MRGSQCLEISQKVEDLIGTLPDSGSITEDLIGIVVRSAGDRPLKRDNYYMNKLKTGFIATYKLIVDKARSSAARWR